MAILTNTEIHKRLSAPLDQGLTITPLLDPAQVGEASIDVRLGTEFILMRLRAFSALDVGEGQSLREKIPNYQERVRMRPKQQLVLHPNQLALGATLEYLRLPSDIGAYVIGRSSWGRVGLVIATASSIAPGFKGCVTLELVNLGEVPLVLYPGMRIAQLVLHTTTGTANYRGKYTCPTGPQFSRVYEDEELPFWCSNARSVAG